MYFMQVVNINIESRGKTDERMMLWQTVECNSAHAPLAFAPADGVADRFGPYQLEAPAALLVKR